MGKKEIESLKKSKKMVLNKFLILISLISSLIISILYYYVNTLFGSGLGKIIAIVSFYGPVFFWNLILTILIVIDYFKSYLNCYLKYFFFFLNIVLTILYIYFVYNSL